MIIDRNKGITSIEYNHLDLPTEIVFENNQNKKINYIYDATGIKQKKIVNDNGNVTTTEYCQGFIYQDNQLQFFSTSEGYISVSGSNIYSYAYNYADHLGNIRLSYIDGNDDGQVTQNEVIQENNYYPFGMVHRGYNKNISSLGNSAAQKFKYNGIEFEEVLGLNMMEMEMRHFDPTIARWVVNDPVTHYSVSTYTGFDNSPIYWADPSGADVIVNNSDSVTFTGDDAQEAAGILGIDGSKCDDCKEGQKKTEYEYFGIEGLNRTEYFYHAGGVNGSTAGWKSVKEYAAIIKPIAEELSKSLGGWKGGYIGSMNLQGNYDAYISFMASRNAIDGFTDFLIGYGNLLKRTHNNKMRSRRGTGNLHAMGIDSPFFGGFLGLASKFLGTSRAATTTAVAEFYPANNGFLGAAERQFLMPGQTISRFGSNSGKFFSPAGTPRAMRALAPGSSTTDNLFRVLKPFEVQSGTIAPAFGQSGLGTQFLSPVSTSTLIKRGIITPF